MSKSVQRLFKVMARIFALSIFIQVFLAGLALFWDPARWAAHRGFSRLLFIEAILILILALLARLPLALRLRSAALVGFIILIAVSAALPSDIGYLGALHPVLAMMLLFGAVSLVKKTDSLEAATAATKGAEQ